MMVLPTGRSSGVLVPPLLATTTLALTAFLAMAIIPGVTPAVQAAGDGDKFRNSAELATTDALVGTPTSCSERYHTKLVREVLPTARATQAIADRMRTPVPGMPGHWQFWDSSGVAARSAYQQRLLSNPQQLEDRMCVRSILARGGRIRCLKWKAIPAGYKPPPPVLPRVDPTKTEISAAERRIAASLARRVSAKGAFSELARGRAFYHMAQRTTNELIAYASQPHRESICTGTAEVIEFYRRQLKPLVRNTENARQLLRETREAAIATARVALGETNLTMGEPDFVALTRALLQPFLDQEEIGAVEARADLLGILILARDFLSDQRFDAIPEKKRGALRKALRNIEFMHYAAHNQRQIGRLDGAFDKVFEAILEAHGATCDCEG